VGADVVVGVKDKDDYSQRVLAWSRAFDSGALEFSWFTYLTDTFSRAARNYS